MDRKNFIKTLAMLPLIGTAMKLNELGKLSDRLAATDKMPVLFVGHGSPTNAIDINEFSRRWQQLATEIPVPKAVLIISAHWLTRGTQITAMEHPKTIHDFGGFSQELYEVQYPAPGSPTLAASTAGMIHSTVVGLDHDWGLDHGAWSITKQMYPHANIPILQLSIDYSKPAQYHYDLAQQLMGLRDKGVLILGSGNMVHNLRMISLPNNDFNNINKEYGFDWALEMNQIFKDKISHGDHKALIEYEKLSKSASLAIPTPDHYYPLIYTLALQGKDEQPQFFNDKAVAGSLTMTSVKFS